MYVLRLILKNALRHKLRTALTIVGIVVAITAFGLLRTVIDAWYAGANASSSARLVTRNAVSLVFSLPLTYVQKIRQVDGVTAVSWANWFGGVYVSERNFFPQFAIDPPTYLEIYPEFVLSPEERKAFLTDRQGACINCLHLGKRLNKTLRKVRRKAGKIRDCDVQLKSLKSKSNGVPQGIIAALKQERRAGRKKRRQRDQRKPERDRHAAGRGRLRFPS